MDVCPSKVRGNNGSPEHSLDLQPVLLKSWGHRYYNTKGNIWLIARSAKHPNLKWGWIRTLGLIYTLYLCHVWDGWIASPTQWTWVWANSGRQWRTGKPGMWQFMVLQIVRHNWATEQQQVHIPWLGETTALRWRWVSYFHYILSDALITCELDLVLLKMEGIKLMSI